MTTSSALPDSRWSPALDVYRTIAVLVVMFFHFIDPWPALHMGWLQRNGWLGVDLFFVQSGYLIGSQLLREHTRTGQVSFRLPRISRANSRPSVSSRPPPGRPPPETPPTPPSTPSPQCTDLTPSTPVRFARFS